MIIFSRAHGMNLAWFYGVSRESYAEILVIWKKLHEYDPKRGHLDLSLQVGTGALLQVGSGERVRAVITLKEYR